jgi:serine/threonine protein kinase
LSLQPGRTLAHYRIDHKLGEGGMGEVWAATDTRLNRSAAIKALPAAVAADEERLARFKREAQLLAALNHTNIAAIYGLEQDGDTPYLALEMVEGDDLSARLAGGRVPVDEALEIALQIAAALEEAHEKGIVHRDLKPANIKVTADGKVKVLDFGLAKALADDPSGSASSFDLSVSPTLTAAAGTEAGVILGTASYMSPEQARGKPVDRRADVWAFGVILFEMLTGERLFAGETVTDVIAAVVTREPEWDTLPADTPPAVRRVLKRCLRQDPRERIRDIGDARG